LVLQNITWPENAVRDHSPQHPVLVEERSNGYPHFPRFSFFPFRSELLLVMVWYVNILVAVVSFCKEAGKKAKKEKEEL